MALASKSIVIFFSVLTFCTVSLGSDTGDSLSCDNTKITIQDGVAVKIESEVEFNDEWVWPSESSEVEEASNSIDIESSPGKYVFAARDGEVLEVGVDIYGVKFVILNHNDNTFSRYKGLGEITICKGDIVRANETIGKQGLNKDEKPILNFVIGKGRNKLNPLDFLPKQ